MRIFSLFLLLCFCGVSLASDSNQLRCVILLHGLARSHTCMSTLEKTLKHNHFIVINRDYPSTKKTIKAIADEDLPTMIAACLKYNPTSISFVTHSMGGIILQKYLQHHVIPKLDRIVMLSPPNHGSEVANILHDNWLYQFVTGPAGQELTTWKNSTPNQLRLLGNYQIGIIAGTYNFVPFGNYLFEDANDGAVSVSSAKTKLMKDFVALPVSHAFMMDNPLVHMQVLYFLNYGKFIHKPFVLRRYFRSDFMTVFRPVHPVRPEEAA